MTRAIKRAAERLSSKVKTDADLKRKVEQIQRCMTRDELMPAFLNVRMEVDPNQVFRVLKLSNQMLNGHR